MWSSHKLTAVTSSVVTFCCFIDTCNHTLVLRFCLVYTTPRCPSCASGKTLGSNLLIMRTRVPLNTNCPMTQSSLATILYCLQLSKSVPHRWVRFLSSRQCVWVACTATNLTYSSAPCSLVAVFVCLPTSSCDNGSAIFM